MNLFHQGDVLVPVEDAITRHFGLKIARGELESPIVYLGKNRWLVHTGKVRKHQDLHRRIIGEFLQGWWRRG